MHQQQIEKQNNEKIQFSVSTRIDNVAQHGKCENTKKNTWITIVIISIAMGLAVRSSSSSSFTTTTYFSIYLLCFFFRAEIWRSRLLCVVHCLPDSSLGFVTAAHLAVLVCTLDVSSSSLYFALFGFCLLLRILQSLWHQHAHTHTPNWAHTSNRIEMMRNNANWISFRFRFICTWIFAASA